MLTQFSVGICAFNEEKNIIRSIKSALRQQIPNNSRLTEVIVVASGCTDLTVPKVQRLTKKISIIKLIVEKNRLGKASAVNQIIKNAKSNIIILQGADVIPASKCYSYLLQHTTKKDIGMVGGKIIPLDNPSTFFGYINHLKWKLHHNISIKFSERPKLGELILFRKIFSRIPPKTAVDEASIEPIIKLQGYRTVYEPNAVIYNQGPKILREYLSQRRRIYAGHYENKIKYGYEVITFSSFTTIPVFLSSLEYKPKELLYSFAMALLEIIARLSGYLDIKFHLRDHTIWKAIASSKNVDIPGK